MCAARLQTVRLELEEGEAEVPRLQSTPAPGPRARQLPAPSGPQDARRLLPARTALSGSQTPLSLHPSPDLDPPRLFSSRREPGGWLSPSDPPGRPSRVAGVGGVAPPDSDAGTPRSPGPGRTIPAPLSLSHTHITRSSPIGGVGSPPPPTIPLPPGPRLGTTLGTDVRPGGRGRSDDVSASLSASPFLGGF